MQTKPVTIRLVLFLIGLAGSAWAEEFHVAKSGNDAGRGCLSDPLLTISAAAARAQPGDTITVHAGTYRERVSPPRGGISETQRIVYRAADGEQVEIKGSEVIKGWKPEGHGVWKVTLPNAFFGDHNPYAELIAGDWFNDLGRPHHTGEVYLNGQSLFEAATLAGVRDPKPFADAVDQAAAAYTWFAEVSATDTTIYANFHANDPNQEQVEIHVRPACFYPAQPGIHYITVRGFRMRQAATQWAPPTAEQIGLIGTHWSRGWVIENNIVSDAKCSGITLGKDRDSGQNIRAQNPEMPGYVAQNIAISNAVRRGWTREQVGHHIVRNNTIYNCEQTGICGHMGGAFSRITGNHIHNIWVKRQFSGAEIAAIKLHGAVDGLIAGNRLHDSKRGLWLDWMTQGTRVSENLLYNNTEHDVWVEVNHGPFLFANNIFLSNYGLRNMSHGGAYVHNLIAGKVAMIAEPTRFTPYFKPHTVEIVDHADIPSGDDRFFNNLFTSNKSPLHMLKNKNRGGIGFGLDVYDMARDTPGIDGNVYFGKAKPYGKESNFLRSRVDPGIELVEEGEEVYLRMRLPPIFTAEAWKTQRVTSHLLGTTLTSKAPWETSDGKPFAVDTDYFGNPRCAQAPTPGPFEGIGAGEVRLKVWPRP